MSWIQRGRKGTGERKLYFGKLRNIETLFFHGFPCIWISGQFLNYSLLTESFKATLQLSSPQSGNQSVKRYEFPRKEGLSERPVFIFFSKTLHPETLSLHQEALLMAFPFESSASCSTRVLKRLELSPSHLPANITALPACTRWNPFSPEALPD